ncbi:hypothetical protein Ocin01_15296 [Orchesella cincta]|uniref:DUF4789 domain-containing protein n=1 Tax=Orchesella cincta TaxID=48709 RepID=A0A1D2MEF2_ORCCI|nr:hypothetical protein Ocin01_15296 [Orchesella cincta]
MQPITKSFNFIFLIILSCNNYVGHECYRDAYRDSRNSYFDSPFRLLRNTPGGRHPLDKGVQFAWQNPIRVAPTLPPVAPQQDPAANTKPPRTDMYVMTTPRSTNRSPNPTSAQCQPESRLSQFDGRCHTLGSKGSCNENMAFYADPTNEKYGHCDCLQNVDRPLVYHPETDKCYFVFQQAFCPDGSWLALDSQRGETPFCDVNRCRNWTATKHDSNWDWKFNGEILDATGPIALFSEQTCALLGWPCNDEGTQQLKRLLPERTSANIINLVRLKFDGINLVCAKGVRRKPSLEIECKPGLFNKWRQDGKCK